MLPRRMSNLRTPTPSKAGWWQGSAREMCAAQSRVTSAGPPARTGDHRCSKAGGSDRQSGIRLLADAGETGQCLRESTVRRELIAAILATLLGCDPVFAQVGGIGSPTPGMGPTSPFGMSPATAGSVGPA